jgi:Ca2+-binding EF-hand superfamily protein
VEELAADKGVNLKCTSLSLEVGQSESIVSSVTEEEGYYNYDWGSSNIKVATVDANGTVRGISAGTAVIYCYESYGDGKDSQSCSVTVTDSNATGVALTSENFPDDNFRAYLKEQYDDDGDGYIYCTEIKELDVESKEIKSLKGIEYFLNLEKLTCEDNALSSLDVRENTNLKYLYCSKNNLSDLDISKNVNLLTLSCSENNLSNLDVSKNVKLTGLYCSKNNLNDLDVSNNINLWSLMCYENNLSELDVSYKNFLTYLHCQRNNLSILNVSGDRKLEWLDCTDNNLRKLDVRNNVALRFLACYKNNLRTLDISNNTALETVLCSYNFLESVDTSNNTLLTTFDFDPQKTFSTPGDTTGDGEINISDMMQVLNHISGKTTLTDDAFDAGDVNGDGKVDLQDLMKILNFVSGKSTEL